MVTSTREQIIQFIARQGSAGTAEIGRAFSLTQAAVRYHLSALLRNGKIELIKEKIPSGRSGHPARTFRIAPARRPDNYAGLANALLDIIPKELPLSAVPDSLAEKLAEAQSPSASPARRIKQTMKFLEDRNYQPAWEARAHGPRIRFENCPYAVLLKSHPELCRMDSRLLEILTGGRVTELSHMDIDSTVHTCCFFDVNWR